MGVGSAFYGVANLLINRGMHVSLSGPTQTVLTGVENLYKRVSGIVSFVAENPVRAIASPTQVWLSKWYREVSGVSAVLMRARC